MEENENISFNEKPGLIIDEQGKAFLGVSAKWAKVISIIMFISIALIIILGFAAFSLNGIASQIGNEMEGMDQDLNTGMYFGQLKFISSIVSFIYIAVGLVMLYPALKLFQFSEKTQTALRRNDSVILKTALENHKSFFKFTGIMYLVMIGFSIVVTIGMIIYTITSLKLPLN